jgi:soluble lytic murein transglycosylase-like protein
MRRQKTKARKIAMLVELLLVGSIVCTTAVVMAAAIQAPSKPEQPPTVTAPTEQTETVATVPTETQPETTATAALMTWYDVPLDKELQLHIIETAESRDIDPAVIFAMIWKESTYHATAKGDGGNSLGLMQIQPRWHKARMKRLECPDLLDPFQNVTVGIDILAGLIENYDGNVSMALMAYNAGPSGAYSNWFSQGIYSNSYSKAVLNKAAQLETYQA